MATSNLVRTFSQLGFENVYLSVGHPIMIERLWLQLVWASSGRSMCLQGRPRRRWVSNVARNVWARAAKAIEAATPLTSRG